jgi:hypothetical protein
VGLFVGCIGAATGILYCRRCSGNDPGTKPAACGRSWWLKLPGGSQQIAGYGPALYNETVFIEAGIFAHTIIQDGIEFALQTDSDHFIAILGLLLQLCIGLHFVREGRIAEQERAESQGCQAFHGYLLSCLGVFQRYGIAPDARTMEKLCDSGINNR